MSIHRAYWVFFLEACKYCRGIVPSIFLTLITISIMYVAFQTARPHQPPLEVHGDGMASTALAGDLIMVEYERDIHIREDFTGAVSRTVTCENGWSHDIPATLRKFEKGTYHANRSFTMPYAIPSASRCKMLTLITWTPFASLREHSFKVADIPFVLIPHEHPRKDEVTPHTHEKREKKPLTKPDEVFKGDLYLNKDK